MAWSPEAIVAVIGVLINVPTFCVVLWRIGCRKRRNITTGSARSLEHGDSEAPILPPRRFALETEYALALPYAVPLINMAEHPNRQ